MENQFSENQVIVKKRNEKKTQKLLSRRRNGEMD